MRNDSIDSIESLVQRHYGSIARTPAELEQRLHTSVRDKAATLQRQQLVATRISERRMSRRQVVRLVALGTAGLGILNIGLEGLQAFEDALVGQEATQTAYP
jgi:hypothetical protein